MHSDTDQQRRPLASSSSKLPAMAQEPAYSAAWSGGAAPAASCCCPSPQPPRIIITVQPGASLSASATAPPAPHLLDPSCPTPAAAAAAAPASSAHPTTAALLPSDLGSLSLTALLYCDDSTRDNCDSITRLSLPGGASDSGDALAALGTAEDVHDLLDSRNTGASAADRVKRHSWHESLDQYLLGPSDDAWAAPGRRSPFSIRAHERNLPCCGGAGAPSAVDPWVCGWRAAVGSTRPRGVREGGTRPMQGRSGDGGGGGADVYDSDGGAAGPSCSAGGKAGLHSAKAVLVDNGAPAASPVTSTAPSVNSRRRGLFLRCLGGPSALLSHKA